MPTDIIARIEARAPRLSKGQKQIANYIVAHYDKAAFMTASRLGQAVGVSESTVVRFAAELGFEGYPALQERLQEIIRSKLTAVQRIELTNSQIGKTGALEKVLNSDIDNIKKTLETTNRQSFNDAVEAIINAKRIYILGVRSSAALASFLGFYFNLIFENVRLVHTTSVSEMFEQILRVEQDDVVIGISFPRYSKRTIKAMLYASDKGAKVISITDSPESPLAPIADHLLLARSDMASFVDSLVAPLSLINALIVAVGLSRSDEVSETFHKLEQIWEEYEVYEKEETGV